MENQIKINYYDEEEEKIITPPYYRVMYVDDMGKKHIAIVTDLYYLQFLKDRYGLEECVLVPAE